MLNLYRSCLSMSALLLTFLSLPLAIAVESIPVDFNHDVRPILSDHCFACHGPDAKQRKGGLRLDLADSATQVTDSGSPAVVPGDPEASSLIARIMSDDEFEVMPPRDEHKPLSDQQKEILKRWIAEGASFSTHWSFVKPERSRPPIVNASAEITDPIDLFILERVEQAGLKVNGEAKREAQLRRVTFDLSGLPPSIEQIEAFVSDTSPDAYEKVIDRLLESPRFGEHMARYWLDLVRYGDTHGLHLDNYREMWPYRDWVIRSFNDNKPFDRFITEQVAGDLLPGDKLEDQIASGFNRLNVTTNEGGSIYEEVFARNVIDRTDAFGTIFLGLTVGCAVCHDHKFDPISQRDFYSLSAFFNSLDGQAMDGNIKDHPPVVRVPTESHQAQLEEVKQLQRDLEDEMNGSLPTVDADQRRWEQSIAMGPDQQTWVELNPTSAVSSATSTMVIEPDGSVSASGDVPEKEIVTIEAPVPGGSAFQIVRLDVLTGSPEERAGRSPNGNAVLSEFELSIKSEATGNKFLPVKLIYAEADFSQTDGGKFDIQFAIDGKVEGDAGWAIAGHQKPGPRSAWFVAGSLLDASQGDATLRATLKYESMYAGHSFKQVKLALSSDLPRVSADKQLNIGPWHVVGPFEVETPEPGYWQSFASQQGPFNDQELFNYRGEKLSWQLLRDYRPAASNVLGTVSDRASVAVLHRRIHAPVAQKVRVLLGTDDGFQLFVSGKKVAEHYGSRRHSPLENEVAVDLQQGDNDLYLKVVNHERDSTFSFAVRSPSAPLPLELVEYAKMPEADREPDQQTALRNYYRRVASIHPDWLVLRDMAEGLRKREIEIRNSMPTTLVWKETAEPRVAHILERGEYDKPGEAVVRAVPAALSPFPEDAALDRRGLAAWLVSPEHPLTARVAVNRFWQQVFGVGLVKTSEDFGAQGSTPSHPQLLDTLAVDFQDSGWNVKQLMKRLVMSAAYRRDSSVSTQQLEVDPNNRLLARGPRFRLDAEMIRDTALFTSGLLVEKLGGPSVKPPQPSGLWRAVGYTSSNTAVFTADEGDKIYRRSVYTFWKRTSAPPQMSTFDAPSRESCTARRERTNTPLQALMLMNEQQMLESAEHLAKVAQSLPTESNVDQIAWMYRTVVSRTPNEIALEELVALHNDLTHLYSSDPEAIQALGAESPEFAATILVASTILNLDDAINK